MELIPKPNISIILPARNESEALRKLLPRLRSGFPNAEIIVVDDGSTDMTQQVCAEHEVRMIVHPYRMGNGAAIKSGARVALGDILIFMDADGQHKPEDIPRLLEKLEEGFDMVIGARANGSQANMHRAVVNRFYNRLASWIVGQKVADLTSGFRAARADKFRRFLYLLPNGFSYPTTITMSFFRAGFFVAYVPVVANTRVNNKSHLRIFRDGIRFLLIIFRVGTLYSPLKIFFPTSLGFFILGLSYYVYTFATVHRFTNMSALLFITSVLVFLMGLLSEQITMLNYKDTDK